MKLDLLRGRIREGIPLEHALKEMKEGSCSVLLGWSEDDRGLWECSWIVGGVRFTSYSLEPRKAVLGAVEECLYSARFRRSTTEYGGVVYTDDKPLGDT